MKRQKISRAALLVVAAAGLTMLGAGPAAAHPAAAGHRAASARPMTASAPLLAMFSVNEDTSPGLCPDASGEALGVDAGANLVEAGYTESKEPDCDVLQVAPQTLAHGWDNTTQVFADAGLSTPSTQNIFSINTDGDLTQYVMHYQEGSSPWLDAGTVIGSGWNSLTNVTYAGNGVFYAVDGDGNLLWYRFDGSGWANGGAGAVIGTGWQNFPLVFGWGGAIYASTTDGTLLWYGYSDPANGSGTWADNSGAVVGTGWNTVLTATANAGSNNDGHVVIHTVGQDGNVHFYDHFGATDGDPTWADVSGVVVRTGWVG